MSRWDDVRHRPSGREYAARFERLAASGHDPHGEAGFCATLVSPPARVLDAGCGTGRVAIELARRGYECVGVDIDAEMLAVAREAGRDVTWIEADLAELDKLDLAAAGVEGQFEVVVAAGNVIPLVAGGTEALVTRRLAGRLAPDGLLVTGFGLDAGHLPLAEAPFTIEEYDEWCAAAGLELRERWSTWDGDPWIAGGGYAVSVHVPSRGGEEERR